MIELRKVNEDNIEEVIALEVGEEQKELIEVTNLRCIADAYVLNEEGIPAIPFAIYADGVVVGFYMYTYDTTDHESFQAEVFFGKKAYFIYHLMIGKRYQGKGYGKLAFERIMADIEKMPSGEADYVDLFYHENNAVAKNLYASFGFIDSGVIQGHSVHANKQLGLKATEPAVE
ncbi:spermine/spermidine acetyltransferase [Bacillus sp. JCM 19045]|nr:spermine/spermidine acetyltransferase [Bacillus sp. JCM 19045]